MGIPSAYDIAEAIADLLGVTPSGLPVDSAAIAAANLSAMGANASAADIAAANLAALGINPTAAAIAAEILAALGVNPTASAIAAAINVANVTPSSVEIVAADALIATGQWTAAIEYPLGATFSGRILTAFVSQRKGTGPVLSDMYGRLGIWTSNPTLAAGSTTLTTAQSDALLGEVVYANSALITDTNSARLWEALNIPFASISSLYVAFFWKGATSINATALGQQLFAKLGITRDT